MRLLLLIASVWAICHAKPEMYRESEDFQYSRSSTDEGKKSGFYGAQRGNVGGNYERAHNMDGLAQHQMSSAVRQVEGELGDGAKERSGSVYTAANSRGVFGSGHYDLSNLKGRNFDESSISDSLSHSSLTSQNAGYRGWAHNSGYNSGYTKNSRHNIGYAAADYSEDHSTDYTQSKSVDNGLQAMNQQTYGSQQALGSDQYYSRNSNRAQSQLREMVGANQYSTHDSYGRQVTDSPVRGFLSSGKILTVPVSAQTFDASSLRGASYGQHSLNTEAEELRNSDSGVYVKPNTVYYTKPKHYESSYSYRKEWEKHNAQPVAPIATENPLSKNSEVYEHSNLLLNSKNQFNAIDSSSAHVDDDMIRSSSANNARLRSQSAAHQSTNYNRKSSAAHQSQYNYETAQSQNTAASEKSNAYTLGAHNMETAAGTNDLVENIEPKPKSYQSSYSYHKSWERRGDPYVIKPIGGDNSAISQRLVSGSANQGDYSSHQYGSLYNQAHHSLTNSGVDCDEHDHVRVARSAHRQYYPQQQEQQSFEDLGQQTQNQWDRLEDPGQQTQNQWDRLEDLGQHTQSKWDNTQDHGQQSQNLEDFGQQSQNLEDFGQQSQNLEDFGQQSQNIEDFGQHGQQLEGFGQNRNLEDLGQQTQNQWDNFGKHYEQSPSAIHPDTQEKEIIQEPTINEHHMGPLSIFKPHQDSDKPKLNSFLNQHPNFDGQEISHNTDNKRSFTNENFKIGEDQELQNQLEIQNKLIRNMYDILSKQKKNDQGIEFQKPSDSYNNPVQYHQNINFNDGENQYTGLSHYSHQSGNNYMSSSWHKQYHIEENDNNDQPISALQNFWSKLDNLDAQGTLNTNYEGQEENSYPEISDIDWTQKRWEQFHGSHDINMFEDSLSQNQEKYTVIPQISKETMPVNNVLLSVNALTTVKPRHDNISKKPVNPIDVGRGDIGADETTEPVNEDQHTNVYVPNSPQRYYKTLEEIESLSLTKENIKLTTEAMKNSFDNHNVLGHTIEDSSINGLKQTSTTNIAIQYQPTEKYGNTYIDKYAIPRIEEIKTPTDDIPVHETDKLFPSDIEQKNDQVPWKVRDIEQNTDQQFEDLGQELQTTFDISQQTQSVWDPSNVNGDGIFENNDSQHLEPLERSKYALPRIEKIEKQTDNKQVDAAASKLFPLDIEQKNDQVPWKVRDIEQNTDQQFEDLGQELQTTFDIGQQTQSVRDPSKINEDGVFENNDGQHLEPLERSKYALPRIEKIEKQIDNKQVDAAASKLFPLDIEQKNDQEPWKVRDTEQNTDQQFEDLGQELQTTFDIGQQTQSVRDPSKINEDGVFENNDSQHLEPLEGNYKFQSHRLVNSEQQNFWQPKEKELNENHSDKLSHPIAIAPPSPEETEKPGFWKSVGGKLRSAKDTVVSWFKAS